MGAPLLNPKGGSPGTIAACEISSPVIANPIPWLMSSSNLLGFRVLRHKVIDANDAILNPKGGSPGTIAACEIISPVIATPIAWLGAGALRGSPRLRRSELGRLAPRLGRYGALRACGAPSCGASALRCSPRLRRSELWRLAPRRRRRPKRSTIFAAAEGGRNARQYLQPPKASETLGPPQAPKNF